MTTVVTGAGDGGSGDGQLNTGNRFCSGVMQHRGLNTVLTVISQNSQQLESVMSDTKMSQNRGTNGRQLMVTKTGSTHSASAKSHC